MNLETPLTQLTKSRPKAGPSFSSKTWTPGGFIDKNFVLTLANNHMMDYGEDGLLETINSCRNVGAEIIGAGTNLEHASQPVMRACGNIKVGILACCETQFGIASGRRAGVSPISPRIYQ